MQSFNLPIEYFVVKKKSQSDVPFDFKAETKNEMMILLI